MYSLVDTRNEDVTSDITYIFLQVHEIMNKKLRIFIFIFNAINQNLGNAGVTCEQYYQNVST